MFGDIGCEVNGKSFFSLVYVCILLEMKFLKKVILFFERK